LRLSSRGLIWAGPNSTARTLGHSDLLESHPPFDGLSVGSLRYAIQLQYVCSHSYPEMSCDFFRGSDHADALRGAPERDAIALGELNNIWNVSAIGGQSWKPVQRQYHLFKRDWVAWNIKPEALHSQHARLRRTQRKFRPLSDARGPGGLRDCTMRHKL